MGAYNKKFMKKAIELSILIVAEGGGPFGSVITKNTTKIGIINKQHSNFRDIVFPLFVKA